MEVCEETMEVCEETMEVCEEMMEVCEETMEVCEEKMELHIVGRGNESSASAVAPLLCSDLPSHPILSLRTYPYLPVELQQVDTVGLHPPEGRGDRLVGLSAGHHIGAGHPLGEELTYESIHDSYGGGD